MHHDHYFVSLAFSVPGHVQYTVGQGLNCNHTNFKLELQQVTLDTDFWYREKSLWFHMEIIQMDLI